MYLVDEKKLKIKRNSGDKGVLKILGSELFLNYYDRVFLSTFEFYLCYEDSIFYQK